MQRLLRPFGLRSSGALLLLGLAVATGVPRAAAQTEPVQEFAETTSIQVVEVPVRVLVKGEPVRGLTAEDFEIYDDGKRREISGFEIVDVTVDWVPEKLPTGEVLPPQERRNFLFLFDFAYGGDGMIDARRRLSESVDAARRLVESGLTPSDRIAVAFFSQLRGLKLVVDFTREREPVMLALHAIDLIIDGKPKVVREEFADWALLAPSRKGRRARTPLGPNQPSLDDLVAEALIGSDRGDPTLQHDLVIKHFTWGMREFLEAHTDLAGMNYMVLISRGMLYGDNETRALFLLQEMFRDLRQENWSIQAIDTGGFGFGRDSLLLLANETGGRLFTNTRSFDVLMKEVAETTAVTYMLAFQVENLPEDGAYHRLEVQLVNGPKKARLTHRPGYYAPGMIEPEWQRSSPEPESRR